MNRYARISSGLVAEIIDLPDSLTPEDCFTPDIASNFIACTDPSVGEKWLYDENGFAPPRASEPTFPVPDSVTSAQAKIQLLRTPGSTSGKTLLDDVKAGINAAGGEVAIWFTDARSWDRMNPYVTQLGKNLKLSDAEIDALFINASKISA